MLSRCPRSRRAFSTASACLAFAISAAVAAVSAAPSLLPPTDPSLHYIGRFDLSDPAAARFQWPLTAIEVAVRCSSAGSATFKFTTHDPNARFKLLVNGTVINATMLSAGEHALTAQLSGTAHAVRLSKDTEDVLGNPALSLSGKPSEEAPAEFHGVVLGGACVGGGSAAARALAPARTLEVYGDSISCGFGNQALSIADKALCLAGAAIEPITKSDPAILSRVSSASDAWHVALAERVGAEIVGLQCISGIGMCKNGNDLKATSPYNMSHFAAAILPFQVAAAPWAFSGPAPDVVVIK